MSRRRAARLAATLAVVMAGVVCAAAAAGTSRLITASSIAGAPLGATQAQYGAVLGKATFSTSLPGNVRRITYLAGTVSVNLRRGHGYALLTSSDRFKTAAGIGPCTSVASLRRAYRTLVPVRVKGSPGVAAYRSGHILFVTPGTQVVAVMLANHPLQDLRLALNAPHCGAGREG